MNETRAALRRLRVLVVLLIAIAIYGATEPHRDSLSDRFKNRFNTGAQQ